MDVGSLLRSLGLGQYESVFRDNAVDAEVLFELNDGDLAQLGVLLGHRKRLLKAIAGLVIPEPAAKPANPAPLPLSTVAAERRPITVMFCDLGGSTGLAAKLDAEDWRNLVNAYLDEASKAGNARTRPQSRPSVHQIPIPRLLPKFQATFPPSTITPLTWSRSCCSSAGRHGTS